ncbi:helix-turn-helix domain-containing transcriptional regulator [Magnetococcales bacterium HHB-1]
MATTRSFHTTILERAREEPEFRQAMLLEAVNLFLSGDMDTGRAHLRDYVNATASFPVLASRLGKNEKSVHRMLGSKGNPTSKNLFKLLQVLQELEGITLEARTV